MVIQPEDNPMTLVDPDPEDTKSAKAGASSMDEVAMVAEIGAAAVVAAEGAISPRDLRDPKFLKSLQAASSIFIRTTSD